GPISCHHHYRLYRRLLRFQLLDRFVHIDGVSLVVETQNRAVTGAERTKCLRDTGESGIAVCILLGENGDLPGLQPPQFDQVMHHGVGFLRVARTIVEYIAIGWVTAQYTGACEGAEEQQPSLQCVRDRNDSGGGPDISNDTQDLIFLVELFHGLGGPRRFITVISRDEPEQSAVDASGVVDLVESG